MKIDAVFEGGGVKGIGFAGAISEVEKRGYTFENIAGSSAGAIVAALLAVGYTSDEIKHELETLDYKKFKDKGSLGRLSGLLNHYGMYKGDYFEKWIEELLERKGITTFGQLITEYTEAKYKYKLQIIASDITNKRLLILPQDLTDYGFDPDQFSISKAVRMSMSIPLFFSPVQLTSIDDKIQYVIDGGVLSNYPIWLLDDQTENPPWPTFGFKLIEPNKRVIEKGKQGHIKNLINYCQSLISTMLQAHDKLHISKSNGDFERTIGIPTAIKINEQGDEKEIKTTDFDITKEESLLLYQNGVDTAKKFFDGDDGWDFEDWKNKYRKNK